MEIELLLFYLTSFFTLINPLGVMPIYMTMTSSFDQEMKRKTALKATIVSFITLVIFAVTGQLLFKFFGITVDSLKVVGGIIFFLMGQDMLQARLVRTEVKEIKTYANDISITPLAIPMICGPGAITNAIVLMETTTSYTQKSLLILSIFVVTVLTYLILVNSAKLHRFLGETGNNVLMRLMGLIVMVIAIEFMVSGLKPIIRDILML
ncbi:MarC family protein [Bacillus timonensis]|nr:MarC family protein [Bacillus timonensis]